MTLFPLDIILISDKTQVLEEIELNRPFRPMLKKLNFNLVLHNALTETGPWNARSAV